MPSVSDQRLSRRGFLTAGAAGIAGLSLVDLLRAEEALGIRGSRKAVINIHLDGGPPQMDMIDPKPEAPAELRGPFRPIETTLPGVRITELMPRTAKLAERFAFIRSLVGADSRHDAFQCQSGFRTAELSSIGGQPAMGCVLTKLLGSAKDPVPTFVDLMQGRPLVRNSARTGYLGPSFRAFRPDLSKMFPRELEPAMKGELQRLGANHQTSLVLSEDLTSDRLSTRLGLLERFDRLRREVDASGMMDAVDRFHQQAVGILTSGSFAEALDISREDPVIVERYTPPPSKVAGRGGSKHSEDHRSARKLLLARRLVEAGARCVSVSFSDFDTHSRNFPRMRHLVPIVDHAICALVTDLEQRGLLDDVSIVIWGEFGRTPKVNGSGGRDHWPQVGMAMLAGGGMRTGQVVGETDRIAATATERPVRYAEIFATLYHNLGIDSNSTTILDPTGRPQYLVDGARPISELI